MKNQFIFLLLFLPATLFAQKFEYGNQVTISQPVYEDLYIAGKTVIINAPIHGDLVVAGGTVTINDSVTNDMTAAGGEIFINGVVSDDIRIAGGRLYISKPIGGDLVITGGRVQVAKEAEIAGSLIAGGGEITIDGTVKGFVKTRAGTLTFNGSAEKSLDARAEEISINGRIAGLSTLAADDLMIGKNAAFINNVRYWSEGEKVDFGQSIKNGRAIADNSLKVVSPDKKYLGFASVMMLLWYLGSALLLIILIELLFGRRIQAAVSSVTNNILRSIGYGFLFFILMPIAIILALITLIGIPLGLLMILFFLALIMLSLVITSVVLANWINVNYYHNRKRWRQVWTAFALFIILRLILLIPVAGWLLITAAVCMSFGILIINIRNEVRSNRTIPVA